LPAPFLRGASHALIKGMLVALNMACLGVGLITVRVGISSDTLCYMLVAKVRRIEEPDAGKALRQGLMRSTE
jgi:hypothetical protein